MTVNWKLLGNCVHVCKHERAIRSAGELIYDVEANIWLGDHKFWSSRRVFWVFLVHCRLMISQIFFLWNAIVSHLKCHQLGSTFVLIFISRANGANKISLNSSSSGREVPLLIITSRRKFGKLWHLDKILLFSEVLPTAWKLVCLKNDKKTLNKLNIHDHNFAANVCGMKLLKYFHLNTGEPS